MKQNGTAHPFKEPEALEGTINVWIEPWGISLSSPNADYLAGWLVVREGKAS